MRLSHGAASGEPCPPSSPVGAQPRPARRAARLALPHLSPRPKAAAAAAARPGRREPPSHVLGVVPPPAVRARGAAHAQRAPSRLARASVASAQPTRAVRLPLAGSTDGAFRRFHWARAARLGRVPEGWGARRARSAARAQRAHGRTRRTASDGPVFVAERRALDSADVCTGRPRGAAGSFLTAVGTFKGRRAVCRARTIRALNARAVVCVCEAFGGLGRLATAACVVGSVSAPNLDVGYVRVSRHACDSCKFGYGSCVAAGWADSSVMQRSEFCSGAEMVSLSRAGGEGVMGMDDRDPDHQYSEGL